MSMSDTTSHASIPVRAKEPASRQLDFPLRNPLRHIERSSPLHSMIAMILLGLLPAALAQVRVLYQNDLSLNSNATSALFIGQPVTGQDAAAACASYNEQLLPSVTSDLREQLDYLVFRGILQNSSQIYTGGSSSTRLRFRRQASCQIYNVGFGLRDTGDCTASLPVLCTNSAPPFETSGNDGLVPPAQGSEVTASSGQDNFLGYRDARSFRFLGIPFAQKPIGDLRFANARPYNQSYNSFFARNFSPGCIQNSSGGFGGRSNGIYSEDCLYLNVYTPEVPSANNNGTLPVAFWIYGGSFSFGDASLPSYDGGNMASRGDVVVVTANYRVGALGNLASQSLNGSQGITDQIEALKWIQKHISTFGGDPERVTIFGESAGAISVLALMSSTPAKGLFSQAISQSGRWNPFLDRNVSIEGIYPGVLAATGCNTTQDEGQQLSCLRSVEAANFATNETVAQVTAQAAPALRAYSQAPTFVASLGPWYPTAGTGVIDGLATSLIAEGSLPSAGIPFMIGTVQDEGTLFLALAPQLQNPLPAVPAVLNILLGSVVDNSTGDAIRNNPDVFAFNDTNSDALRYLAGQIVTLDYWQCPLQQQLAVAQQKNTFSALYSFRFDKGASRSAVNQAFPQSCTANSISGYDAVCHSEDVPIVFGTNNIRGDLTPFDDETDLQYTQYVQDCWTSFIRTGNPQPDAAYLEARGSAYSSTLAYSQVAPFEAYSGGNSSNAIHVFDAPPSNSMPFYQAQCQILQDAGFQYDNVQGS